MNLPVLKEGDQVKRNAVSLEEDLRKNNHHLYQRIIREESAGVVDRLDNSYPDYNGNHYWVKFAYATILLSERHLTLQ